MTEKEELARANEINRIRHLLKCTTEEAIDVIEQDEKIDKGESVYFDMTKEQAKVAIKQAQKGIGHGARETPIKRERKVDNIKKQLLDGCKSSIETAGGTVTAEKTETEITFDYNGETYTLKLTKHRKAKG